MNASWMLDKVASGYVVRISPNAFYDYGERARWGFSATHAFTTLPEALDFMRREAEAAPIPQVDR